MNHGISWGNSIERTDPPSFIQTDMKPGTDLGNSIERMDPLLYDRIKLVNSI